MALPKCWPLCRQLGFFFPLFLFSFPLPYIFWVFFLLLHFFFSHAIFVFPRLKEKRFNEHYISGTTPLNNNEEKVSWEHYLKHPAALWLFPVSERLRRPRIHLSSSDTEVSLFAILLALFYHVSSCGWSCFVFKEKALALKTRARTQGSQCFFPFPINTISISV